MYSATPTNSPHRHEVGILWSLTPGSTPAPGSDPGGGRFTGRPAPGKPGDHDVDTMTATALPTTTGPLLANTDQQIELGLVGTEYRLHLQASRPLAAEVGRRVTGVIRARAKRVDKVGIGGRFVEPVFGRPRRVQGRVVGRDEQARLIFISCGPVVVCQLTDARQSATDFADGNFVACDLEPGATFET
ncbi:MAG: hypothetical protein IT445_04715 [Phycisphaeraceae bacterium]|nr:hypothetical protein [Phycisphaeraceae bacterium]